MTKYPSVVWQALVDLLRTKWIDIPLNQPDDVYLGEQSRYPRTPAVAVVMTTTNRVLTQTGMQATISFNGYALVIHAPIQNVSFTNLEVAKQTENIVDILDGDKSLGGLLVHSFVVSSEIGVLGTGGGELMITTRLTWAGFSKLHV